MKKVKPRPAASKTAAQPAAPHRRSWVWAVVAFGCLFAVFEVYQPAIRGPFLFDDAYLQFFESNAADRPLKAWITPIRPMLSVTWWMNLKLNGLDSYAFHLWNVFMHFAASALVCLIAWRLLQWAGETGWRVPVLTVFAGSVFLLHPLQTESVSYIASRSETLSVMFAAAALAAFVWRRSKAISFLESLAVLVLFGAACLSKEHVAILPAVLLLTDYFWNPGFSFDGVRRNWRLYLPMVVAGGAGLAFVMRVLLSADTAGFGLKDLTWYQYFFTQCRALWMYLRFFVLPAGQNIDHDFAVSRNLLEHGAIIGLLGLLAAVAAAWRYRREYPLASYGFFMALILFAPTSSFVPIRDTLVERRLYLPMIGLLLIVIDFLRRWKAPQVRQLTAMVAVLIVLAAATRRRNQVWSTATAVWEDSVAKSPNKSRPHFQLAFAHYREGRCDLALKYYQRAAELEKPDYRLLVDWAHAYECAGQSDEAIRKLEAAAAIDKTAHVYALIGMVHAKHGRRDAALAALETAAALNPRFAMTYAYRGNVFASGEEFDRAAAEYRRALALDASNLVAIEGLRVAEQRLRQK